MSERSYLSYFLPTMQTRTLRQPQGIPSIAEQLLGLMDRIAFWPSNGWHEGRLGILISIEGFFPLNQRSNWRLGHGS